MAISRAGIINRLLTVFLFSAYVTFVLPNIKFGSFLGSSIVFSSLMIVAYGISKALASSDDRKYLIISMFGLLLPLVYFVVLGGA